MITEQRRPGVYIHFPFCRRKCLYCNFDTLPLAGMDMTAYIEAVLAEAAIVPEEFKGKPAPDTLYLGGGSPSLLNDKEINVLINGLRDTLGPVTGAEISLEVNPEDVTPARLEAWRQAGINRLSLGVQTFRDETLAVLERPATRRDIDRALEGIGKSGFGNVNLDLILGLPGESAEGWRRTLEQATALAPQHLSIYLLEVSRDTPMGRRVSAGEVTLPSDDLTADLFEETVQTLAGAGWEQYEISNFARPGYRCRHNLKYWDLTPFRALGAGAHGFDGQRRYWNILPWREYLQRVHENGQAEAGADDGGIGSRMEEYLVLGLRRSEGVDLAAFQELFCTGVPDKLLDKFKKWVEDGWLINDNTVFRLSLRGMLVSNELFLQIFGFWSEIEMETD